MRHNSSGYSCSRGVRLLYDSMRECISISWQIRHVLARKCISPLVSGEATGLPCSPASGVINLCPCLTPASHALPFHTCMPRGSALLLSAGVRDVSRGVRRRLQPLRAA